MSLTAEQLRAREGKLTASRVKVLMDGDDQALYDLWRELMGDPSYEQPDLSGVWAVQLGSLTEELNLNWYEYRTGREVIRRGEVVASQERPWAACTLDGWTEEPGNPAGGDRRETVIECKHVGGFEPLEKVVARYQPQVQWQMYCHRTAITGGAVHHRRREASRCWRKSSVTARLPRPSCCGGRTCCGNASRR